MRYEIGSHFEYNDKLNKEESITWLPKFENSEFTFTGEAAIELAIKEILLNRQIKNVYMPSYCCESMIEPFIKNEINVLFYDVYFKKGEGIQYDIDLEVETDLFFAISYFGIEAFQHDSILKLLKEKGTIIIEDITHRLLNDDAHSVYSDYIIASLRKWFPISTGGYIAKKDSQLKIKPFKTSNHLVEKNFYAMEQKTKYLRGEAVSKDEYLDIMDDFEQDIEQVDYEYKMDDRSLNILKQINIEQLKRKRRHNAAYLYEGIKNIPGVNMLVPHASFDKFTPLFLPIMLEETKRDDLRASLIQNNIYCPVHWPKTKMNSSQISNHELSLICDQRYTKEDMEFIKKSINEWQKNEIKK